MMYTRLRHKLKFLYGVFLCMILLLGLTGCGTKKMAGVDPAANEVITETDTNAAGVEETIISWDKDCEDASGSDTARSDPKDGVATELEVTEEDAVDSTTLDNKGESSEITVEQTETAEQTKTTDDTDRTVSNSEASSEAVGPDTPAIDEDGTYTSKDDVALYIHTYGKLPNNFITKKEAEKLGWSGGSLEPYAPGKCIGGSYFGNYEGNLPEAAGREYHECDIDTLGKKSRGAKRIVYSNDGLIYYTDDHYETFTLLY